MSDVWQNLSAELDRWQEAGKTATFWWRDDDASAAGPDLDRLLHLKRHFDIPLHLAVIPGLMQASLADMDRDCFILQHGLHHQNRAAEDAKKSEFPDTAFSDEFVADLLAGRQQLQQTFAPLFLPVMVPPWNRMSQTFIQMLPKWGFRGLSRYSARDDELATPGLGQVNTHLDPVDWRGGRGYIGDEAFVGLCIDHLKARRKGAADFFEPTGLLSHHKVHDEDIWAAIFKLLDLTLSHGAARWITLPAAFSLIDGLPDGLMEIVDDEDAPDDETLSEEWGGRLLT